MGNTYSKLSRCQIYTFYETIKNTISVRFGQLVLFPELKTTVVNLTQYFRKGELDERHDLKTQIIKSETIQFQENRKKD